MHISFNSSLDHKTSWNWNAKNPNIYFNLFFISYSPITEVQKKEQITFGWWLLWEMDSRTCARPNLEVYIEAINPVSAEKLLQEHQTIKFSVNVGPVIKQYFSKIINQEKKGVYSYLFNSDSLSFSLSQSQWKKSTWFTINTHNGMTTIKYVCTVHRRF